jgi:glucose-6-phosphate 1-dehydrogenase
VTDFQPYQKPQSYALVIFGVTGNLTNRLVIPALYNLGAAELLPEKFCRPIATGALTNLNARRCSSLD